MGERRKSGRVIDKVLVRSRGQVSARRGLPFQRVNNFLSTPRGGRHAPLSYYAYYTKISFFSKALPLPPLPTFSSGSLERPLLSNILLESGLCKERIPGRVLERDVFYGGHFERITEARTLRSL
jgi:hypothetical protein